MDPIITTFFATLEFGERRLCKTVAVLPIFSSAAAGPDYLTLSEAMAAGTLTITEVDAQGTVPELYAMNSGALPVLLLDGEEVAGVNQNRAMNTTMLLPAYAKTRIPVSCTEHGRWRRQSAVARSSGNVLPHRLRAQKQAAVSASLERSGRHASNQGAVWEGIADRFGEAGATSPTGAMADLYTGMHDRLEEMLASFPLLPGQRGFLAFVRDVAVSMEYLSSVRAYAKLHGRLLRSVFLDAITRADQQSRGASTPRDFLALAAACTDTTYDAVGCGREHRLRSEAVVGSALELDDAIIHLSLLSALEETPQKG